MSDDTTTTEIHIDHRRDGRDGRKVALVTKAGTNGSSQTLHLDSISIGSARARAAYVKALLERAPGVDQAALEDELLKIAEHYASLPAPATTRGGKGVAAALGDLEPWPDEVGGPELLRDLVEMVHRFLVLPPWAAEAMALWVLFAHTHDAHQVSPILLLTSPVKQCGKSRTLELLAGLVPRPLAASSVSAAALYRAIEQYQPTMLIDEFDAQRQEAEDLRGVINSGWQRATAHVVRVAGEGADMEPRLYSTWAPKVLAMIGAPWDTVLDRSISIRMQRKGPAEEVERWRSDRAAALLEPLARRCARWASDHLDELRDADPAMPRISSDRATDNWRCLVTIAEEVGGEWPELARAAAETMAAIPADDDSSRILLLEDMRDLFAQRGTDRLTSEEIAEHLADLEERPWPEWKKGKPISKSQIARMLKPFGAKPGTIRQLIGGTAKGYYLENLEPIFDKYLPPPRDQTVTTTHERNDCGNSQFKTSQGISVVTANSEQNQQCDGVTAKKGVGVDAQQGFRLSLAQPGKADSSPGEKPPDEEDVPW